MFVYQNKNRDICITFEDNKPVENPEFVIIVDEEAKTITLNGGSESSSESTVDTSAFEKEIADLQQAVANLEAQVAEKDAKIAELEAAAEETEAAE